MLPAEAPMAAGAEARVAEGEEREEWEVDMSVSSALIILVLSRSANIHT